MRDAPEPNSPLSRGRSLGFRERRKVILEILDGEEFVATSELAARFGITEMSVRRDLEALAGQGTIRRVRGGAVPLGGQSGSATARVVEHAEEKRRIGAVAAECLAPGVVVFVDGGSTTIEAIRALPEAVRSTIAVVTHSRPVLDLAAQAPVARLVALGGFYVAEHDIFAGPQTLTAIEGLRADVALVGCDGLSADGGLTTPHELAGEVIAAMVGRAQTVIAVADSTKVGRRGFTPVAQTESIDIVVTDKGADASEVEALRARGVDVRLA